VARPTGNGLAQSDLSQGATILSDVVVLISEGNGPPNQRLAKIIDDLLRVTSAASPRAVAPLLAAWV